MKGSTLRLTKIDDEIYDHLCKDFPEFDPAETIDENKLKSPAAKKRWRDFMMAYEKKVDDYSFGTMLRSSPKEEYTQHGTIFGKSARPRSYSPGFQRCPISVSCTVCDAAIPASSGYGKQEMPSHGRSTCVLGSWGNMARPGYHSSRC